MLADRIGSRAPELDRVSRILREAIGELRTLSTGIYPPALADYGLAAAAELLAEEAPLPIILDIGAERWPQRVERVAYFVIAESLANVYKHSQATKCRVSVRVNGSMRVDGSARVDGVGVDGVGVGGVGVDGV